MAENCIAVITAGHVLSEGVSPPYIAMDAKDETTVNALIQISLPIGCEPRLLDERGLETFSLIVIQTRILFSNVALILNLILDCVV